MAEIDARLAAIAERFTAQAAETASAIGDALHRDDTMELGRLAHSLAGRAGMFGYSAIGDCARAVEEAIDAGLPTNDVSALTCNLLALMQELNRT